MWQWVISTILSLWASPAVAKVTQAVIVDLTSHGVSLTARAIELVKEANAGTIQGSKYDYVYNALMAEFSSAGKSAIGTALEAAESAVRQGLVK